MQKITGRCAVYFILEAGGDGDACSDELKKKLVATLLAVLSQGADEVDIPQIIICCQNKSELKFPIHKCQFQGLSESEKNIFGPWYRVLTFPQS